MQVQVSTRLRAGFPGETVRVLKEKEVRQFGDALRGTRRLVLEAWDALSGLRNDCCIIYLCQ